MRETVTRVSFDSAAFGRWVREQRKRLGFKSTEQFSEEILRESGRNISRNTLYNLETGQQEIDMDRMAAIVWAIFPGQPCTKLRDVFLMFVNIEEVTR